VSGRTGADECEVAALPSITTLISSVKLMQNVFIWFLLVPCARYWRLIDYQISRCVSAVLSDRRPT
jgi:hypothetical protein